MTCETCSKWPSQIGSLRAAYAFDGPIRDSIHRFKYQGEFARASHLAAMMYQGIFRPEFVEAPRWDVVTYVPLHPRRRRQRGFDQAELLSRYLSQHLELSRLEGVTRRIDTPSQVGRNEDERRANMRDAFSWMGPRLSGEHVLLIDDVLTTGATMVAVAGVLIGAGAGRVDGFALAREM